MEERRLLAWFFRLAQLTLLYSPVLPLLPHRLTIKNMPPWACPKARHMEVIPQLSFLCPSDCGLCQTDS